MTRSILYKNISSSSAGFSGSCGHDIGGGKVAISSKPPCWTRTREGYLPLCCTLTYGSSDLNHIYSYLWGVLKDIEFHWALLAKQIDGQGRVWGQDVVYYYFSGGDGIHTPGPILPHAPLFKTHTEGWTECQTCSTG